MINTKLISVPKQTGGGGTTYVGGGGTYYSTSTSISGAFEPHFLWGQWFDDTADIKGNMKDVGDIDAHGDISTSGNMLAKWFYGESMNLTSGATMDWLAANRISAATFNVGTMLSEKFGLGNSESGYWILEEDNNLDMLIHTNLDKTFRLQPYETEVLSADKSKVKINKKLDLSNPTEGTNVVMGTKTNDRQNNNIKSIVEDGFYIVDNNNNVAIGVSNNYVVVGADMGSPNFLADSYGWRVQPDGTAEFANLKVNGNLDVYTLTYNEMRATNGIMLVTDCACISDAVDNTIDGTYYWIITTDEFPPFAIDDYVQLQYRVSLERIFSFKGIVRAINADGDNTIRVEPLSGFHGSGTSTDDRGVTTFSTVDPDTATGKYIIRIGNATDPNRQTIIKLNPYNGAYIDFMTGLNAPNKLASNDSIQSRLPTATRLGQLSGVTYNGTELSGYGLFSDNAYLAGAIKNLNNKWALNADGSGNVAGQHITWDSGGTMTIKLGDTDDTEIGNYINSQINISASGINATFNNELSAMSATWDASFSGITSRVKYIEDDYLTSSDKTTMESEWSQSFSGITSRVKRIEDDYLTSGDKSQMESEWQQTFSGITSRVTDIEKDYATTGQLQTMESTWQQTASGITSRVSSIETNYVTGQELSAATSEWEQSASGITSRVTEIENNYVTTSQLQQTAESINAQVGNFEIGTRNLIRGTKSFDTSGTSLTIENGTFSNDIDDFKVLYYSYTGNDYANIVEWSGITIEPSTYYTLSFWAKGYGTVESFFYHPHGGCTESGYTKYGETTTATDGRISTQLTATAERYWITWKTKDTIEGTENLIPIRLSANTSAYIWGVKFERGNKASDWSPSPIDNDNDYVAFSQLEMTADNINMSVRSDLVRTGINIETGNILIDADNTEFTGNIKLTKDSDVLSVLDSNGSTVIKVNNGLVSSSPTQTKQYFKMQGILTYCDEIPSSNYQYINQYSNIEIGEFTTSDTFTFEPRDWYVRLYSTTDINGGVYDFPSYNYGDGGTYSMYVKFFQVTGSTPITLWEETAYNQRYLTTKIVTPQYNGKVYMSIALDFQPLSSKISQGGYYGIIGDFIDFYITKYPTNLTTIGRNGLSVINKGDSYMTITQDGFKVIQGNYGLGADKTNGAWHSVKGTHGGIDVDVKSPFASPIYYTIQEYMFDDVTVLDNSGNQTTVKGFEVDDKATQFLHVTGTFTNTPYIVLPYSEGTMLYIRNDSDKNVRVFSWSVSNSYYKNMYVNQTFTGNRNEGSNYYELGRNDKTLILMSTRYGWFNVNPV